MSGTPWTHLKLTQAVPAEVIAAAIPTVPAWFSVIIAAVALMFGYLYCRNSISRVAILSIFSVTLIPLLPGFTEHRQPQVVALLFVTGAFLCSAAATARTRKLSLGLAFSWLAAISALSVLTVGIINTEIFRLFVGLLTAIVMTLAIILGHAASTRELATIRAALSGLACGASFVAIVEFFNQSPFYLYTDFQMTGNSYAAFRASSFLGHPLVLCVFLVGIAVLNLSGPAFGSARGKWFQIAGVVLPLAGAATSISRSIWLFIAVGLVGVLLARADSGRLKTAAFAVAATAVGGGVLLSLGDGFGQRFGELSAQEQRIRLGGFDTVLQITTGNEVVLGAGPKAVAKAFSNNVEGVIYGTVDNQFFTMYAEFGLVGLGLLLCCVVVLIRGIRSAGLDAERRGFVIGALPCAAGFFLMEPIAWPLLSIVFGLGVGAAFSARKTGRIPNHDGLSLGKTAADVVRQ